MKISKAILKLMLAVSSIAIFIFVLAIFTGKSQDQKNWIENPCGQIQKNEQHKHAFKGMEMYSWKNDQGEWVFSILPGTNRNKMIAEAKSFPMDIDLLEKCFCNIPVDENIFWLRFAQNSSTGEMEIFPAPPQELKNEVEMKAILCNVNIIGY